MLKTPLQVYVCLFVLFSPLVAQAFTLHWEYEVASLKTFKGNNYSHELTLERAWVSDQVVDSPIERIQVRASNGNIIAFTPTRVTAIPFCFGLHSCWVFLWKTVYPFPAIYKLNPNPDGWINHPNPPMKYSRRGPAGMGFEDKTNLFFGAFGILLLLKDKALFLLCCILFTIILTLQITRYRDLPEIQQKWIRQILSMMLGILHMPLPVEPYLITAALIFLTAGYGMLSAGVPLVITILTIIVTFFLSAMRLGRAKSLRTGNNSHQNHSNGKETPMSHTNSEEIVLLNIEDGVATVTLNRPEVHNAFDEHMIAQLSALWDELAQRDDVRAVVLKGNGKSFSAGADLNWMKRAAEFTWEQNREDALKLAHMLRKLYTLPQLTIACVLGAAMGGGMGLVSCCDVVIADAEAKFALSEVKLGLIPATIAPYVIRAMGERHARRYFQTGERFDAATAHRIGFVHELAQRPEDVEYLLHTILRDVAKSGPQAMLAAKKLCLDLAGQELSEDMLTDTANRIADARAGDEAREGLAAFLEKRPARWAEKKD